MPEEDVIQDMQRVRSKRIKLFEEY